MMKAAAIVLLLAAVPLFGQTQPNPARPNPQPSPAREPAKERLTLPQATVGEAYYRMLRPRTEGAAPWTWKLVAGRMPPGVTLERSGVLAGTPTSAGDYRFTLEARDSARLARVVQVEVLLPVRDPLAVGWQQAPAVETHGGSGIWGSIEVVNNSSSAMDLTVIIVAVNETGRATALGYQHFPFQPGARQMIPFGSNLPRGTYVVHADAVGEIARTRAILRARQQTNPISVP